MTRGRYCRHKHSDFVYADVFRDQLQYSCIGEICISCGKVRDTGLLRSPWKSGNITANCKRLAAKYGYLWEQIVIGPFMEPIERGISSLETFIEKYEEMTP